MLNKCSVGVLLKRLDHADRAWLIGRLLNPDDYPALEISRVLRADGHDVAPNTINRHRRRADGNGCRCPLP